MTARLVETGGRVAPLRCANLEIRPTAMEVRADRRILELTRREFELLLALAERRNRVVPRIALYERVWGQRMAYRDRSVDVCIRRLRGKLKDASPGWIYIHTHFGVGYRFAPQRVTLAGASAARRRQ